MTLVGATTENPSFEINGALLSRAQVFVLKRLDEAALDTLLTRAEALLKKTLPVTAEARASLVDLADGDGRYLLRWRKNYSRLTLKRRSTLKAMTGLLQKRAPIYDKDREGHYNIISALHKSIRGSDPDAALYWLARMVVGGENLLFIARRLVRAAAEDIGLADPTALMIANAAKDAVDFLGAPEGELHLARRAAFGDGAEIQCAYVAWSKARAAAQEFSNLMPPAHILNAPTNLMKDLGYGAGMSMTTMRQTHSRDKIIFPTT